MAGKANQTSKWCRLYNEALHDPKIVMLTDAQFRMWALLLMVASARNGALPDEETIACETRKSVSDVLHLTTELVSRGLIDTLSDGSLVMHNWKKRQYISDVSTDRVKRFRNGQGNVSMPFQKRPQSTDSDSDSDNPPKPPQGGAQQRVRKRDKHAAMQAVWNAWEEEEADETGT